MMGSRRPDTPGRQMAALALSPPCTRERGWRAFAGSGADSHRNRPEAKRAHPATMGINLQQRPHGGAQRHLQGRTGQSKGLPKRTHLHLHDLPDRSTTR